MFHPTHENIIICSLARLPGSAPEPDLQANATLSANPRACVQTQTDAGYNAGIIQGMSRVNQSLQDGLDIRKNVRYGSGELFKGDLVL